jgi:hypothetical protein
MDVIVGPYSGLRWADSDLQQADIERPVKHIG